MKPNASTVQTSRSAVVLVGLGAIVAVVVLAGCQKKEDPVPQAAPSATPPPAVSIAPMKEPEPSAAATPAPTTSAAASAEASATAAPAAATPTAAAAPKKPEPSGSVQTCCTALAKGAKEPGKYQNRYASAASVCVGLEKALKAGKANLAATKVTLTAQLHGAPAPDGC